MPNAIDEFPMVQFRAAKSGVGPYLEARAGSSKTAALGRVAQRDLRRLYFLLERSTPTFTEAAAKILCTALRDFDLDPVLIPHLAVEIIDRLVTRRSPANKAIVDDLILRLQEMDDLTLLAVVDAVERATVAHNKLAFSWKDALRSASLIPAEDLVEATA